MNIESVYFFLFGIRCSDKEERKRRMIQKMIKICMSFLLLIGFSMEIKGEENPKQGVPDLAKHAQSAYLKEYTSGKDL